VQIDHDLEKGLALWDAIVESTVRRFRPIVLTAAAAILAMIPLTRSTFWGPMAWAIMGGLFVATLLTLLFLPALYASWYKARRPGVASPEPQAAEVASKAATPRKLALAGAAASLLAWLPSASAIDLVGAHARAMEADVTIQSAHEALAAGREKAIQGAALYKPRVTLSASSSTIRDHSELSGELAAISKEETSGTTYGAKVEIVQPIYRPGTWADARQLKEQAGIAEIDHSQARRDLIERVTQAYFGVVLAEENVRVVSAQKAAVGEQLERSKARFEVGKGRSTDVEDAQARYDSVIASEIAAQGRLDLNRAKFTEVTGVPANGLATFGTRFVPPPPRPDNLAEWTAKSLDGNARVLARRAQVKVAAADIDRYRLAGRPTLDLVASYGDKGQSGGLSPLVSPDRGRTATIGLQLSIPLYQGGGIDSREREARAKQRQAEYDLAAAERDARLQVRDAFLSVKNGAARIAALDQALVSAATSLEATIAGRDVGTRTTPDVLDAQQRFFSAQLDLAQARFDYLLGRVQLASVSGELGEDDVRALNAFLR
jgi:outer membrane protein